MKQFNSPTRFHDAGDLTSQRQFTKTNAAQMKLSQVCARPPTTTAPRVTPRRKFRLAISFRD